MLFTNRAVSIALMLMLLNACNKNQSLIIFDSRVFDPNLQLNVEDATVKLLVQEVDAQVFNPTFILKETIQTDEQGKFRFEFENALVSAYRIEITKDQYVRATYEIGAVEVVVNNVYSETFHFYPEGWLQLDIRNDSFSNLLSFRNTSDNPGCETCCTNQTIAILGIGIDTTMKCMLYGAQTFTLEGFAMFDNIATNFSHEIEAVPFDTTYFLLEY